MFKYLFMSCLLLSVIGSRKHFTQVFEELSSFISVNSQNRFLIMGQCDAPKTNYPHILALRKMFKKASSIASLLIISAGESKLEQIRNLSLKTFAFFLYLIFVFLTKSSQAY